MRHFFFATGILVIAASSYAQTAGTTATEAADTSAPPLTKTVAVDPSDSPLVRAAKRAVASRQHPNNRRIVKINGPSTGRGRFAESTGPVNGPNLPATPTPAPATVPEWQRREQQKAAREAETQKKMQELAREEQVVGAELDEPYGGDIEEDAVEQRMSEAAAQRERLQNSSNPNPPRP